MAFELDKGSTAKRGPAPRGRPAAHASPAVQGLLMLQKRVGNTAVVEMLRRAGHPWAHGRHQHSDSCGRETEATEVQRSTVRDVLRGSGRPLAGSIQSEMESRLDADFSDVRLHTDSTAKKSAAELGARAYTSGSHVVIGEGGGGKHTLVTTGGSGRSQESRSARRA